MEKLLNEMIHKMRTPVVSLQLGVGGIKKFLPSLIEVYHEAKKSGLVLPEIHMRHLELLLKIIHSMEKEADFMNKYLDEIQQLNEEGINYG